MIFTGGLQLLHWSKLENASLIERLPRSARPHVISIQLDALGIDPGPLTARRLHQEMFPAPLQLYYEEGRLPLAGWPNEGWAKAEVIDSSNASTDSRKWRNVRSIHPEDRQNAWAHGFWSHDWEDSFEPLQVDGPEKNLTFATNKGDGPRLVRNEARYRLENILSELDSPGEWYVDRNTKTLIYWPVKASEESPITATICDTLLSIYDTENVHFEGFRFENARCMAVEIVGGQGVSLSKCSIANIGNVGLHVFRGREHKIVECEVINCGSSAIRIEGGDRPTLTKSEHVVAGCHVSNFCQDYLAGRSAIALYGVGNIVRNTHIENGPDGAIAIFGNEHLVEQNHIHHVCRETDDTAAIHLAYDPTYRGNVIHKNFVHDLGGFSKLNVFAIYLDDFASGTTVTNNYLLSTIRGIGVGGGRDNRIENNRIERSLAAIQLDARGTSWAASDIANRESRIQQLVQKTLEDCPTFAERYPELTAFATSEPWLPKGNVVQSNVFDSLIGVDLQGVEASYMVVENNRREPQSRYVAQGQELQKKLEILGIEITAHTFPPSPSDPSNGKRLISTSAD